jgi:hypothetical protein
MRRYVNNVSYSQLFFFLAAICVHVLTPGIFATILLYLYMFSQIAQAVAFALENKSFSTVVHVLQSLLLFILYIVIMADDWCGFFLYRIYT